MTIESLYLSLGVSLGLTLMLELVFAFLTGIRAKKDLVLVCAVNIATNPAAVLLYRFYAAYAFHLLTLSIIVIEVIIVLTEALYYKRYSSIRCPFVFSLAANLFSFGVGQILNFLF